MKVKIFVTMMSNIILLIISAYASPNSEMGIGILPRSETSKAKKVWSLGEVSWLYPPSFDIECSGSGDLVVTITVSPALPKDATIDVVPTIVTNKNLKFTFTPPMKTLRTADAESLVLKFKFTVPPGQEIPTEGVNIIGRVVLLNPSKGSLIVGPNYMDTKRDFAVTQKNRKPCL
jgi:hypothetical protein